MINGSFSFLLKVCAAGLIALLVGGWMQNIHPAFDSLSHFRLHFSALLAALVIVLIVLKSWSWGVTGVLTIAVSLYLTAPFLEGIASAPSKVENTGPDTAVRIVQMNLRYDNRTPEAAAEVIGRAKPDILLLQEVTDNTGVVLTALKPTHPHQLACHQTGVGSVAIVSRFPFVSPHDDHCAPFFGYASAGLKIEDKVLTVASFHSLWPWPFSQAQQINRLAPRLEALPHPLVLAGDFNSAPWSAAVQGVAQKTRTQIARKLLPSWAPRQFGIKDWFGPILPIDQVLTSKQVVIVSRTRLENGGSDHFAILTRIRLMP